MVGSHAASLNEFLPRLRHDAAKILRAGVDAVDPEPLVAQACVRHGLDSPAAARLTVISAGKAASGMLRGLLRAAPAVRHVLVAAPEPRPDDLPPDVEWITAPHPSPDHRSERAGRRALALASGMPPDGHLVVLLSGGASAMLAVPAAGVTLADKAAVAGDLMKAGASIVEVNCVRRHLSAIKGGRLGAAAGWRVVTLALSDVHAPVEDDPSVIGSGPTVPDPTTRADALAIVERFGARAPEAVRVHLSASAAAAPHEIPAPRPPFHVIGNRRTAMDGMEAAARALGYAVRRVEGPTAGEARERGRRFVEDCSAGGFRLQPEGHASRGEPQRRLCVIGSGETVVTVTGDGRGGRNQEFVLGAVDALAELGIRGLHAVLGSAGTDGVDGPTPAAGAIADTTTARRARAAGLDIHDVLRRNDAYPALSTLGDLVTWGPTGTNVGDVHVLLARSTEHVARGTEHVAEYPSCR